MAVRLSAPAPGGDSGPDPYPDPWLPAPAAAARPVDGCLQVSALPAHRLIAKQNWWVGGWLSLYP